MNQWERLRGASPLVVYVDLKSPYAFIAVEPTRAVARAAGVPVEWRPFTLDIPSYLGSARLDRAGRVVENRRSPAQWSGVKYAYRDARRYARLGGRVLRGTEKIWDSSLAGIGLLWAARQSAAIVDRYLDDSYARFWRRELDIEDAAVVAARLETAGAEVAGFAEFAAGAGRAELTRINVEAFAAGIFGVPSYLVADEFWFGREHLPRIAWLLGGRVGASPLPAYPLPDAVDFIDAGIAPARPGPDGRVHLRVAVDIRDPRVLLAWEPTRALARELDLVLDCLPFEVGPPKPPPAALPEEDRGTAHRRYRAEQQAREFACYARTAGLALDAPYRGVEATAAHLGLLWARRLGPAHAEAWLTAALAAYWSGALEPADAGAVAVALARAGVPVEGFEAWATRSGPAELVQLREDLQSCGVFQVPTYLVGDEPFQGMAHLPLLRALFARATRTGFR
jgi:2-hydroxychromene-2-carboxylate isomerase